MTAQRVRVVFQHQHSCRFEGETVTFDGVTTTGSIPLETPRCIDSHFLLAELVRVSVDVQDV